VLHAWIGVIPPEIGISTIMAVPGFYFYFGDLHHGDGLIRCWIPALNGCAMSSLTREVPTSLGFSNTMCFMPGLV